MKHYTEFKPTGRKFTERIDDSPSPAVIGDIERQIEAIVSVIDHRLWKLLLSGLPSGVRVNEELHLDMKLEIFRTLVLQHMDHGSLSWMGDEHLESFEGLLDRCRWVEKIASQLYRRDWWTRRLHWGMPGSPDPGQSFGFNRRIGDAGMGLLLDLLDYLEGILADLNAFFRVDDLDIIAMQKCKLCGGLTSTTWPIEHRCATNRGSSQPLQGVVYRLFWTKGEEPTVAKSRPSPPPPLPGREDERRSPLPPLPPPPPRSMCVSTPRQRLD